MASCDDNSQLALWIYIILVVMMEIISCIVIHKFMSNKNESKSLYHLGLTFFIVSAISIALSIKGILFNCYPLYYNSFLFWSFFIVSYGLHVWLLLLYLFIRLYSVFLNTAFQIPTIIVNLYKIVFIWGLLQMILTVLIGYYCTSFVRLVYEIITLMEIIGLSLSLSLLFIYKLRALHQNMKSINKSTTTDECILVDVITKNTILCCSSIAVTILFTVTNIIVAISEIVDAHENVINIGLHLIAFGTLFDTFSNLLLIALSYRCFEDVYLRVCGGLDQKCKSCWIGTDAERNGMSHAMANSARLTLSTIITPTTSTEK